MDDTKREVLKREQAAKFLQFSVRKLDQLVASNQIPFKRSSKSNRFSRPALVRWLEIPEERSRKHQQDSWASQ